jgi:hypothetical protein
MLRNVGWKAGKGRLLTRFPGRLQKAGKYREVAGIPSITTPMYCYPKNRASLVK